MGKSGSPEIPNLQLTPDLSALEIIDHLRRFNKERISLISNLDLLEKAIYSEKLELKNMLSDTNDRLTAANNLIKMYHEQYVANPRRLEIKKSILNEMDKKEGKPGDFSYHFYRRGIEDTLQLLNVKIVN